MRAVIQRVAHAEITIDGTPRAAIARGLLILVGIEETDHGEAVDWLTRKIINLRIFNDEAGVMNLSVKEAGGELMVVSQFTLFASTKKGNRPSYIRAAKPEQAIPIYEAFVEALQSEMGRPVGTGVFGADMKITLLNDGPVTILIDTNQRE